MTAISGVSLGDQQMLLICASEGNSQIEQTKITGSKQVSSSINSYYSPPKIFYTFLVIQIGRAHV